MKRGLVLLVSITLLNLQSCSSVNYSDSYNQSAVNQGIDFATFHLLLSPYGQWIEYAPYGQVWVCDDTNFRPYYSSGYWIYADASWTWVSLYSWGWGPFHYGWWKFIPQYGWIWVPGYEWAPAWVCWRRGPVYYGWAPIEPGITFNFIINNGYSCPDNYWAFVPHAHITKRDFTSYVHEPRENSTLIKNTTIINNPGIYKNKTIERGPEIRDVETQQKKPVEQYKVREIRKPEPTKVENGKVRTYRPEKSIEKSPQRRQTPTKTPAPKPNSPKPEKRQAPEKKKRDSNR